MKYDKTTFSIENDSVENREILMAFVAELPFDSFTDTEEHLEAYSPKDSVISDHIRPIVSLLPFSVRFTIEEMPDVNWNEEWEKNYFEPLLIGEDCLIRAPFHKKYPETKYQISINPNMAFGTGNHETTSLMIEHINNINMTDMTVLDMGCGTGILGIYASLKGCSSVCAIDIDNWSFESTEENCKLNSISNITARVGDANLLTEKDVYHVIFANIHKNIIIRDLPQYVSALKVGGIIILSGFYHEDLADVVSAAEKLGLNLIHVKEKNNWVAASFKLE
ncbi:MAG: 50S ribosomal protein L11 methyltransferase [Mangrovibacterium sp.]